MAPPQFRQRQLPTLGFCVERNRKSAEHCFPFWQQKSKCPNISESRSKLPVSGSGRPHPICGFGGRLASLKVAARDAKSIIRGQPRTSLHQHLIRKMEPTSYESAFF